MLSTNCVDKKTTKAFTCLKIWPNYLRAYNVFKFKRYVLNQEKYTDHTKPCFKKIGYVNLVLKIVFLIFDRFKLFMWLFMCLNFKTWRLKPLMCFFSLSKVVCAMSLFFFSKIKAFMCLIGHVLIKTECIYNKILLICLLFILPSFLITCKHSKY